MEPTFGSLFAGIGGIDLGLERAGWECRWQVEWDAYCQRVLAKHWPDVPRYGDITTVDWSGVERVDLLAGGFPCQPFSVAGKRTGTADDRWLWPEFVRAIRDLRPRYVLVENVPGLLVGGGMDAVLGGLAELGYDAEWESIPAAAVGAPHLRYRVWIIGTKQPRTVADAGSGWRPDDGLQAGRDEPGSGGSDGAHSASQRRRRGVESRPDLERDGLQPPQLRSPVADPDSRRRGQRDASEWGVPVSDSTSHVPDAERERGQLPAERRHAGVEWARSDSAARGVGLRPDEWWATEPDVGRVAHGVPSRVDRLRALGNAVVPQVVEVIGRQLLATTPVSDDTEGAG